MDLYLKSPPRKICCREKLHGDRSLTGFNIFLNLLKERGEHYNTTYTLLIKPSEYHGKHIKYPIRCEAHQRIFSYSMQNLNSIVSCPCLECRKDPKHKNVSVDIVKRRNNGRLGQVLRHSNKIKEKYKNTCALSNSTFELHAHHLDGQDFYTETQNSWEHNGICLCGPIHRDYHNNFLINFSIIKKEYQAYILDPAEQSFKVPLENQNPDFSLEGAEVSRYTFLEYLRFLKFDLKKNQSKYVNALNERMTLRYRELVPDNSTGERLGQITLEQIEKATQQFCNEYKGNNWALADRQDIPFANDPKLWEKVDASWQ